MQVICTSSLNNKAFTLSFVKFHAEVAEKQRGEGWTNVRMDERTKRRLYASPLMSINIKTALLTEAIYSTFPYIKYSIAPLNKDQNKKTKYIQILKSKLLFTITFIYVRYYN